MEEEIWKDIPNYEGLYQISNFGRIRSLDKIVNASNQYKCKSNRVIKGKVLVLEKTKDNYYKICLVKQDIKKKYMVHRLVATAFLSNPNKLPYINHKDNNGLNNNVDNLEWCTQSYNIKYAYKYGNALPTRTKKIIRYSLDMKHKVIYNSLSDGARSVDKIETANITKCCKKEIKSAYGFIWRYLNE